MKILLLQLSDIHFKFAENPVCMRIKAIKSAVQGSDPDFSACLIAMTGDVAFSGSETEYALAHAFFDQLRNELLTIRPDMQVEEVFVPGNHDCLFPTHHRARATLIADVLNTPPSENDSDQSVVEDCLRVQDNFFKFTHIRQPGNVYDGSSVSKRLHWTRELNIGGQHIRVLCYNTAWMSQINEKAGELLAPTWMKTMEGPPVDLTLTLFHHPYNWLDPINGKAFRKQVEQSSDIVLTGHEHVPEQYGKQTIHGENVDYIEGAVLQKDDLLECGFNVVLMDMEALQYRIRLYSWDHDHYAPKHEREWQPFLRNKRVRSQHFEVTENFANHLTDCEVAFSHPRNANLGLADIFVYPDFHDESFQRNSKGGGFCKIIDGEQIHSFIHSHKHVLILGSEKSGKTALAKMLYRKTLTEKQVPLLVTGEMLHNHDEKALIRVLDKCITIQYGADMVERYHQLDHANKVLIVDDFQRINLNERGMMAVTNTISNVFGRIILIASDFLSIEELAHQSGEKNGLMAFQRCSILPLGYLRRRQVIEKWMRLGQDFSCDDREMAYNIKKAEDLITTLIGRNILPASPLFVLTILQAREANSHHNTELGAYGYHYEMLITAALSRAISGTRAKVTLDTIYTFVSRIAYRMFEQKRRYLSENEMEEVTEDYKSVHSMRFRNDEMWHLLEEARVLSRAHDGVYTFSYRYVYYYFVAKYLATHLHMAKHSVELRLQLDGMAHKLYVEDYANIVIFFVYLTKDETMMESILRYARTLYADYEPCDLDTHVAFLHKLTDEPPLLRLEPGNIQSNNDQHRQQMDKANRYGTSENEEDITSDVKEMEEVDEVLRINMAFKTLQVMGQILRNFPGALPGDLKLQIATESYLLGLRTLRAVFFLMEQNLEDLRTLIAEIISEVRQLNIERDQDKITDMTNQFLRSLVFGGSYGVIKRVSEAVGSEHLEETYNKVSTDPSPLAIALINTSIKLDHFRGFPSAEVLDLEKETRKKPFAGWLLRRLVAEHFHLYPVSVKVRQSICSQLGIQANSPGMITSSNKRRSPKKQ